MEHSLNEAQERAAKAPFGPLLIVAGAGTGKTKTLVSRIVYLIEEGMAPEKICAITFTNKAALEMEDRVQRALREKGMAWRAGHVPYLGTFHSFGAKILRKECRALGREPNFAIFDDHDSFELIKKATKNVVPKKESNETTGNGRRASTKDGDSPAFFAERISEIKNGVFQKNKDFCITPEKENQIAVVFNQYEAALERNNAFDFDDLIQKPIVLFKKNPLVLKKYQVMSDIVLVDEWQDINPMQYELIKLLAGNHRNLSVVGDDEQTIYTWRFADIKMFLNFDKDWHDANIHFLEQNYRSTETIINAAQAVAEHNRFRTPKKLWTSNPHGEPIALFEAWGENDEAMWIAQQITKHKAQNENDSVAILYRTNAQSRAIEQALIRYDISYRIFGGLKFYERREIKDIVAALRFAANDRDEVSRERLEKFSKRKFTTFKTALLGRKDMNPKAVLDIFLEAFGYFDYLEENFINSGEREENISELEKFAAEFKTLSDLLEKISLVQSTDTPSGGVIASTKKISSIVHLSTIHMAKGLEFDVVFIAGAAEGILPHIRSIDKDDSLEEERRLMYVAMTRARKKIFISFSGMPSRFLSEIPGEYLLTESQSEAEKKYDDKSEHFENEEYYSY